MYDEIKYILFHNATNLPIQICAFVDWSNSLHSTVINASETVVLHSSVGEWHMDSMFENSEHRKAWEDAGLEKYSNVGKFRSKPCATGNYSWMEYNDPFDCAYVDINHEHAKYKGLIVLRKKNK
jgi:hypothetical protein